MYPRHFFDQYPPFPRSRRVFVAMSFDLRLDARWKNVIAPAIGLIGMNGARLEPHRVDTRIVSDSILTEILAGISDALLVLADVTSLDKLDDAPLRNPNVFYEIGLAHALRLPEEVLLFRSDEGSLLFDVANIRVNRYHPDTDPLKAREQVRDAIAAAIQEINLTRSLLVQSYAARLDVPSWTALSHARQEGSLAHPVLRTVGDALSGRQREAALGKLLELGLIETQYPPLTAEELRAKRDDPIESLLRYKVTNLGAAVFRVGIQRLGLDKPELQEVLASFAVPERTPDDK